MILTYLFNTGVGVRAELGDRVLKLSPVVGVGPEVGTGACVKRKFGVLAGGTGLGVGASLKVVGESLNGGKLRAAATVKYVPPTAAMADTMTASPVHPFQDNQCSR